MTKQSPETEGKRVCKHYLEGGYRFDEMCRYEHPLLCNKMYYYGSYRAEGWRKQECDFTHPEVC